jgi:hypothetical protein
LSDETWNDCDHSKQAVFSPVQGSHRGIGPAQSDVGAL